MTTIAIHGDRGYRSHQLSLLASQARELPTPSSQTPVTMMTSNRIECVDGYLSVKVMDVSMAALLDEAPAVAA